MHAGSAEGFVDGAALVFCAKKGAGDYHTEMDAASFQKWFVEHIRAHSMKITAQTRGPLCRKNGAASPNIPVERRSGLWNLVRHVVL